MGFPDHHLCRLSSLLPLAPGPGLHLDARAEDGPRKDEVPLPLPLPLSMPRPRMPGRADMAGQRSPESLTGEVALSLSHPRSTFSPSTHSARHSMVHVRPLPSLCRTASTRTKSAVLFRQFRGPALVSWQTRQTLTPVRRAQPSDPTFACVCPARPGGRTGRVARHWNAARCHEGAMAWRLAPSPYVREARETDQRKSAKADREAGTRGLCGVASHPSPSAPHSITHTQSHGTDLGITVQYCRNQCPAGCT